MRKVLGVGQSPGARGMESPHTHSRSSAIPARGSPESEQGRWERNKVLASLVESRAESPAQCGGVRKDSAGEGKKTQVGLDQVRLSPPLLQAAQIHEHTLKHLKMNTHMLKLTLIHTHSLYFYMTSYKFFALLIS